MTIRLCFGRPPPGTAGETLRVVHIFPAPAEHTPPTRLTALCGTSFGPGELEPLDRPQGTPCESCLRQAPTPETTLDT